MNGYECQVQNGPICGKWPFNLSDKRGDELGWCLSDCCIVALLWCTIMIARHTLCTYPLPMQDVASLGSRLVSVRHVEGSQYFHCESHAWKHTISKLISRLVHHHLKSIDFCYWNQMKFIYSLCLSELFGFVWYFRLMKNYMHTCF